MKFFETFFDMLGLKPPAQPESRKAPVRRKPAAVHVVMQPLAEVGATLARAERTRAGKSAVSAPDGGDAKPKAKTRGKTALYETMTREMLQRYDIRVRKWRTSMSGVAWYVTYRDGSVQRLVESPKPKSPMSAAIFLHEVGHHAIGFNVYKPRCLEEYHAWQYSLAQMRQWNIPITPRVMQRYQRSMRYAVGKARRRGIRALPSELLAFAQDPGAT